MSNTIPLKQCSRKEKCINTLGSWLPATTEYFYTDKRRRDKLTPDCRICRLKSNAEWRDGNHDYFKNYDLARVAEHNEYARSYRKDRKEALRISEHFRYMRRAGQQKKTARDRRHSTHGRFVIRAYKSRPDVKDRNRIRQHNRRATILNLPHTLTEQEWAHCLEYFDYRCAVCGRPIGLWHSLAMDHWIAVLDKRPDNPGTVATNIVPLCHTKKDGEGSCNQSKLAKDPIQWLMQTYGKRKANQIIKRIEAYFEWVKTNEPV